jgi:hypothetical protein
MLRLSPSYSPAYRPPWLARLCTYRRPGDGTPGQATPGAIRPQVSGLPAGNGAPLRSGVAFCVGGAVTPISRPRSESCDRLIPMTSLIASNVNPRSRNSRMTLSSRSVQILFKLLIVASWFSHGVAFVWDFLLFFRQRGLAIHLGGNSCSPRVALAPLPGRGLYGLCMGSRPPPVSQSRPVVSFAIAYGFGVCYVASNSRGKTRTEVKTPHKPWIFPLR